MPARVELAGRAEALAAAGTPFVWATVVRAERPTSAKPGDSALVLADGQVDGFVGGDCAGVDGARAGVGGTRDRHAAAGRVSRRQPDDLGPDDLGRADEDGVVTVHNPCLSGGSLEIFLEPSVPLPVVAVFRSRSDRHGVCCARIGCLGSKSFGWRSPMIRCRLGLVRWSSPRTATTRSRCLRRHYERRCPYVALVASRRRSPAVLASLEVHERLRSRVRTPAGLDIGARTPLRSPYRFSPRSFRCCANLALLARMSPGLHTR